RGPQRGHRMRVSRGQAQQIQDGRRYGALALEPAAEVGELVRIGQLTVEQQMADFFERRVLGQVFDLVSAVDETPFLAVDLAQLGFCNDDALYPSTRHKPVLRGEGMRVEGTAVQRAGSAGPENNGADILRCRAEEPAPFRSRGGTCGRSPNIAAPQGRCKSAWHSRIA